MQLLASFKNGMGEHATLQPFAAPWPRQSPHDTIVLLLQDYISRFRVYIHIFLHAGTKPPRNRKRHTAFATTRSARTSSVRMAGGLHGASGTVALEAAGTVDVSQAEAAADDEGVPVWAGVERREGVADRLNRGRRQGRALADVEVCQPVDVLRAAAAAPHRAPSPSFALHAAVCEGVHGTVRDVLAVVQAQ